MQQTLTIKEIAQNALDYHEAGLLGAQLPRHKLEEEPAYCQYIYSGGKHRCAIGASFNPTLIAACRGNAEMNGGLRVRALAFDEYPVLKMSRQDVETASELQSFHGEWARAVYGYNRETAAAEKVFLDFARKLVAEN